MAGPAGGASRESGPVAGKVPEGAGSAVAQQRACAPLPSLLSYARVQLDRTSRRRWSVRRLAAVAFMLALWLATVLLGMSPALHQFLHDDSQRAGHECVLTLLQKGQFFSGTATVSLITMEPPRAVQPVPIEARIAPRRDHRVAPGRAPPSAAGVFTVAG